MSGATDCYQPIEGHFRLTRGLLEVLAEFRQPVGIITKNFLVTRDLDLLAELARWQCVVVNVSVTTLDAELAGKLEPRAARPEHRLRAIRLLAQAGVPVNVLVAPVIPGLTDHELPAILPAPAPPGPPPPPGGRGGGGGGGGVCVLCAAGRGGRGLPPQGPNPPPPGKK